MFERVIQIAELAATSASRRQFLGRLGRGALAAAASAGGLLGNPDAVEAARNRRPRCCNYRFHFRGGPDHRSVCRSDGSACPPTLSVLGPNGRRFTYWLSSQERVKSCDQCV
jgi:hypothetical protein